MLARCLIVIALVASLLCTGCGNITDKDRIRIARVDDTYITRGDLFKILHDMNDNERPKIRNKGDLLRVLNQHIDATIKLPLGKQLADEGKIKVDRETAREEFFKQSRDQEEEYRNIWKMEIPANGQMTPLMQMYSLTPAGIQAMKDLIEQGTDKVQEQMLADQAVAYLAATAFKAGDLKLSDEDLKREYSFQKSALKKFEWMKFRAFRFPAAVPNAAALAAEVRQRLNAGADFDALLAEYLAKDKRFGIESEIENNPDLERFRSFWQSASGANPGDILGPLYLPEYQQISQDAQGRTTPVQMPDAYLILKVLDHKPETELTIEEAKMQLAPPILIAEEMKRLRDQHHVEIYEDKLPDPAAFGSQLNDPVLGF